MQQRRRELRGAIAVDFVRTWELTWAFGVERQKCYPLYKPSLWRSSTPYGHLHIFMSTFINSYAWVILILGHYFLVAYLSFRAQQLQTFQSLFVVWSLGLIPYWVFVTRYSRDLVLAGFIYDFAVAAGWALGVLVFQGKGFTAWQYVGIGLMVSGVLVFKR